MGPSIRLGTPSSGLEVGFIPSAHLVRFCRGYGMSITRSRWRKALFNRCRAPSQQDPAPLDDGSHCTTSAAKRVGLLWDEAWYINVTDDYSQCIGVYSP